MRYLELLGLTLLFLLTLNSEMTKRIWNGIKTRKESLEVDWTELEKSEEKL